MLQPPPPAKVMEGKVPVSRAVSAGSKSSGRTLVGEDPQLSRMVQEKLVKEKMMNSNRTEHELIESLFITRSNRSSSFPRPRSMSFDGVEDPCESPVDRRRLSRLRPVVAPPGCEEEDDAASPRSPEYNNRMSGHAAQRPKLETINSTGSTGSRMSSKRSRRQRSNKFKTLSGATSPVGDDSDC